MAGPVVHGLIFSSAELPGHGKLIDEFEGEGYRRVITTAVLKNSSTKDVNIYELEPSERPENYDRYSA